MRRTNRNRIELRADVVFRYPVFDQDKADLLRHAQLQQAAHDAGLLAPAVREVNTALPDPYMVMDRIGGIALIETTLDDRAQATLAADLRDFLHRMWAVRDTEPPDVDWVRMWRVLHEVVPGELTRAALTASTEAPMRLTHGDLSGGNLMVDDRGHLLGVLDWDGARLSDPAMDWSALCANVPAAVADELHRLEPLAQQLDSRAARYLATWGLQNDLWQADRHPWVSGDTPVVEPRV